MQEEQGFSSFFAIFDDSSKFHSTLGTLHFEKSSNLVKMGKGLAQLLPSFLHVTSKTQIQGFGSVALLCHKISVSS